MGRFADASELRALKLDLDRESPRVGAEAAKVLRAAAARVKRKAAVAAPAKSGTLRRSIGVDFYGSGSSTRHMSAVIGPTAYYGRFVENGTVRQPPHPFMQPALDAEAPALVAALSAIVGKVLE